MDVADFSCSIEGYFHGLCFSALIEEYKRRLDFCLETITARNSPDMANKYHLDVDKSEYLEPWNIDVDIKVEIRFPFTRTRDVVVDFPGKQSVELSMVSSTLVGALERTEFQTKPW